MTKIKYENWLKTLGYIPEFMRDFHDAKDVFKKIEQDVEYQKSEADETKALIYKDMPSRAIAHIYTIDHFLYVMATKYGYTLQKTRKKFKEELNE